MCFWRQDDQIPDDAPPQFTLDTASALKPYFERIRESPPNTGGHRFDDGLHYLKTGLRQPEP